MRGVWIVVGIIGLLAVLVSSGVFLQLWRSVLYTNMSSTAAAALQQNLGVMKTGFFLTFILAVAIATAVQGVVSGWWTLRAAVLALCVISFLDLYRAGRPFVRATVLMNQAGDPQLFEADESINFLKQRQAAGEVFRAFDLPTPSGGYPQNGLAVHGIEQLAGHHGNEMGSYRELIGGPEPTNLNVNLSLFDITNTMYVTSAQPVQLPGFTEVFRGSRSIVYRKADVLPRAYLVGHVEVWPDTAAVNRLLARDFDFRRTAVLPERLPAGANVEPDAQATVQWTKRTMEAQAFRVRTATPQVLVVLDNYYKAWHARIDGKDVPVLRANHTFRGVVVPAGEHSVEMFYDASYLKMPALASAIVLLVLAGVAFGPALRARAST